MTKRSSKAKTGVKTDDLVPAPHHLVYQPHDPEDDRLATHLMLAGESIAAPLQREPAESLRPQHAVPEGDSAPPPDFAGLAETVGQIRALLAGNPELSAITDRLPDAIGSVDVLRNLFASLTGRPPVPVVNGHDGKPLLSEREVEVLKEASRGTSHQKTGEALGIAKLTVKQHFDNIYRKLGVNTPLQAIARAVATGYLEMADTDFLAYLARTPIHNFGTLRTLLTYSGAEPEALAAAGFRDIAAFGLLLLALAGIATNHLACGHTAPVEPCGVVCELDESGKVIRTFGQEHLHFLNITTAPPQAARHGFTPGHLYVSNSEHLQAGLNDASIVEYTPDGQPVRAFCGGRNVATRLTHITALAFDSQGRLLVASGGLTDAILAFTEGGAKVRRWADICCHALCVSPDGTVYATQQSGMGYLIKAYDARGRLLRSFGETPPGTEHDVLAVSSEGFLYSNYNRQAHTYLQVYDPEGELAHSFTFPGNGAKGAAIDDRGRLYLPFVEERELRIVSPEGRILKTLRLKGKLQPGGVALGEGGRMWVCGLRE